MSVATTTATKSRKRALLLPKITEYENLAAEAPAEAPADAPSEAPADAPAEAPAAEVPAEAPAAEAEAPAAEAEAPAAEAEAPAAEAEAPAADAEKLELLRTIEELRKQIESMPKVKAPRKAEEPKGFIIPEVIMTASDEAHCNVVFKELKRYIVEVVTDCKKGTQFEDIPKIIMEGRFAVPMAVPTVRQTKKLQTMTVNQIKEKRKQCEITVERLSTGYKFRDFVKDFVSDDGMQFQNMRCLEYYFTVPHNSNLVLWRYLEDSVFSIYDLWRKAYDSILIDHEEETIDLIDNVLKNIEGGKHVQPKTKEMLRRERVMATSVDYQEKVIQDTLDSKKAKFQNEVQKDVKTLDECIVEYGEKEGAIVFENMKMTVEERRDMVKNISINKSKRDEEFFSNIKTTNEELEERGKYLSQLLYDVETKMTVAKRIDPFKELLVCDFFDILPQEYRTRYVGHYYDMSAKDLVLDIEKERDAVAQSVVLNNMRLLTKDKAKKKTGVNRFARNPMDQTKVEASNKAIDDAIADIARSEALKRSTDNTLSVHDRVEAKMNLLSHSEYSKELLSRKVRK